MFYSFLFLFFFPDETFGLILILRPVLLISRTAGLSHFHKELKTTQIWDQV